MMFIDGFGSSGNRKPLWCIQAWILEHAISFDGASGDVRSAIVLVALRSVTAIWALGQRQLARWMRNRRARAAWFAAGMSDADSMVAAGGS
jgi:hypothetical protein